MDFIGGIPGVLRDESDDLRPIPGILVQAPRGVACLHADAHLAILPCPQRRRERLRLVDLQHPRVHGAVDDKRARHQKGSCSAFGCTLSTRQSGWLLPAFLRSFLNTTTGSPSITPVM